MYFSIEYYFVRSQVFLFQKCNMAGKPAVVTRVVDSMTDNLRLTRLEATDVSNAVLDGQFLPLVDILYFGDPVQLLITAPKQTITTQAVT